MLPQSRAGESRLPFAICEINSIAACERIAASACKTLICRRSLASSCDRGIQLSIWFSTVTVCRPVIVGERSSFFGKQQFGIQLGSEPSDTGISSGDQLPDCRIGYTAISSQIVPNRRQRGDIRRRKTWECEFWLIDVETGIRATGCEPIPVRGNNGSRIASGNIRETSYEVGSCEVPVANVPPTPSCSH